MSKNDDILFKTAILKGPASQCLHWLAIKLHPWVQMEGGWDDGYAPDTFYMNIMIILMNKKSYLMPKMSIYGYIWNIFQF